MVSCASVVWNMAFTEPVMAVVKDCGVGGSGARVHNPPVAVDHVFVDDSSISRVVEILQCFAKPAVLLDYSLEVI
jgi:hypothetical protein